MLSTSSMRGSGKELIGREAEMLVMRRLVDDVEGGGGRSLVVHGAPGVGKSALLDSVADSPVDCLVLTAAGIQSERELPFAGLHMLCAPVLDRLDGLPEQPRHRLRTALGLSSGPPPSMLAVGVALLALLSGVAERQPLLCLVDDQQWLDRSSAQVLAFVARRLGRERVGLVFATRVPGEELARLPELHVPPLSGEDAGALLDSVLPGPVDVQVRDQILAEAGGNPLALLELPRELTPEELAGGFGLPGAVRGGAQAAYRRRVTSLPQPARTLLLVAAADPTGHPALLWGAAERLGVGHGAAGPVADAGLVLFGSRIRFCHPLARWASYRAATARERRSAHRALAEATDGLLDPDRRAWHLAEATAGPDEAVAAELERSAERAGTRGGLAASAAFMARAAALTVDRRPRAARVLAASRMATQAGSLTEAKRLLAGVRQEELDPDQQVEATLVRAQLAFALDRGGESAALFLTAARALAPTDPVRCRTAYLDAVSAAIFAGRLAGPDGTLSEVARAARAAPPAPSTGAADLLLDGLTRYLNHEFTSSFPLLRQSVDAFRSEPSGSGLRWLWLASVGAAIRTWDFDAWDVLSLRHEQLARELGALSELSLALTSRVCFLVHAGELRAAEDLVEEISRTIAATGSKVTSYGAFSLAALRGDRAGATALIEAGLRDSSRGEGLGVTVAHWARALLNNGLGAYDQALAAAREAFEFTDDPSSGLWPLPELVEAATRTGETEVARDGLRRLEDLTEGVDSDWAAGLRARSRALCGEGADAEGFYREAIARLSGTRLQVDLARSHLLFGEWLRRERRPREARDHLRLAHDAFRSRGVDGFAERARRELEATGEKPDRPAGPSGTRTLTAQEGQVAALARDGLSNPEIARHLHLSRHTVQYHLRKVYAKLGISSRRELGYVVGDFTPR